MKKLNNDQQRIIEVLNNPSYYLVSEENGIKGMPYKVIMRNAEMNLEKTLLSLGSLEANGLVQHECAIQRQMVDYLGTTNIEITGQKIIRMFSLTPKGETFTRK